MKKTLKHFHAYLTDKEHRELIKLTMKVKENAAPGYIKTGEMHAEIIKLILNNKELRKEIESKWSK